ncbi:LPS-assembly protein LptD [Azoarcus olearius]|nr:LPS-assembly protein LptD [Azoarcus olearius]
MRLIPLLLCWMSGSAFAAGMPALVVSPDLVRGAAGASAAPTPAPAAATPGRTVRDVTSPVEVRPVEPSSPAAQVPMAPARPAAATGQASPAAAAPASAAPAASASPADATARKPGSTEVRALRIRGTRSVELVAEGDAELQRDDILLTADALTYREPTDEALAEGNVRLRQGPDVISGPSASLVVGERTGDFQSPRYEITRTKAGLEPGDPPRQVSGGGHADVLHFEGENQYRLENATWSTCSVDDPDWYIKARDLQLDYDREIGVAKGGTVVFKDVPFFWMPWAEFPLVGQRQSGVLPPTIGSSNKTGLDLTVPYYWNIAPNYDATITPRYMGRRGLQLGGEFRYLGDSYAGEVRAEWLGRDRITGEQRTLGSLQHRQQITSSLYGSLDINGVSDDDYFEDLSSRVSVASRVNLLREGRLVYVGSPWWSASALVQSYQTLNSDPDNPVTTPYRRVPQLLTTASRPDLPAGLTFNWHGEYVQFAHPDEDHPEGNRFTAYPQLSLPMQRAGFYVTPKVGVHYTRYDLDEPVAGLTDARTSITRTVPIFSVDSGVTFERDAQFFGTAFTQTLEPRLYYLNVPYRRQNDIPLFDTSRYDFGFAQIFAENRYTGGDRIGDANQLTAAVTTRLIDPETGSERMRALVGQRYYFEDQRVTAGEALRTSRRTDVLGGFSGRITRYSTVDTLLQYNPEDNETERFNFTFRYQPEFAKALNLGYRYARSLVSPDGTIGLRDVNVSGQWPLGGGWYGVGRLTHSLKDDRLTEAIAGIEYDGGCWVARVAMHRFATDPNDVTKAVFIQLELNDLASIGSSPVNLIKRSVPGYGKINDPAANRVFGIE